MDSDTKKGFIGLLVILAVGLVGYKFIPRKETLKVCNATVFDVSYQVYNDHRINGLGVLEGTDNGLKTIKPGRCASYGIGRPDENNQFSIYADTRNISQESGITNDQRLKYVYSLESSDDSILSWEGTDGPEVCVQNAKNLHSNTDKNCVTKTAVQIEKNIEINGNYYHFFASDVVSVFDEEIFESADLLESKIHKRSSGLRTVVDRHIGFLDKWDGKETPFHLGAEISDENGPLSSGVVLYNTTRLSIFGDELPLQDGDELLKINDTDIFGTSDVYEALIQHGYTYSKGITEPISVVYRRNDTTLQSETSYFFNVNFHSFSGDREDDAVLYGLTDAITLGLTAEAKCHGDKTLKVVGNVLGGMLDSISDSYNHELIETPNVDKCIWETENRIALAQQTHGETYTSAAWLTIVTPTAPRLLLGNAMKNRAARVVGTGAIATATSTVALELLETGFFFINEKSPLQSHGDVAREYYESIPYIAGIVIAVGTLTRGL